MSVFRRVEGSVAGPDALGILVPPGRRTVLIVRPRALPWDLLLLALPTRNVFRELTQAEAEAGAATVLRSLQECAAEGRGIVESVARPDGGWHVRVIIGRYAFLACPRLPGRPYQPLVCWDADEAAQAGCELFAALHPPSGAAQEIYLNTRGFARSDA